MSESQRNIFHFNLVISAMTNDIEERFKITKDSTTILFYFPLLIRLSLVRKKKQLILHFIKNNLNIYYFDYTYNILQDGIIKSQFVIIHW